MPRKKSPIITYNGHIYRIVNTNNNKCFVGWTSATMEEQMLYHIHEADFGSTCIDKAMREYGSDIFVIELLGYTSTKADVDKQLQEWIEHFTPEYNTR